MTNTRQKIKDVRMITELQDLRTSYYYHEAEMERLREEAKKHSKIRKKIFNIIMKKIDESN